jgi:amino acid transporter
MDTSSPAPVSRPPTPARLGTFAGVFTPSVLTILGIILFLRLGFVTGEAGLGRALVIIALANTISVLTSFSLSAIATNFEVKGGGDYYLISRTLGAQFGGAIGIVLFLAQSISIAFYAVGFGEAVALMLRVEWLTPQVIAGIAVAGLFLLAWLGSDWATRFQYVIMAFLGAALVAFTVGAARAWSPDTLAGNWKPAGGTPFWALFALFFPAVTGFTQGVSMSGELANPARSLPRGTFLAVFVSIVVYFGVAVLFAAALPGSELRSDYGAMRKVSWVPWLIDAGVIAATLSSALASFLGAPRILQSLASDKLVPLIRFFSKTAGPNANPRRGVVFSALIAGATIAAGDLNVIAPVVSMFFLISYGLLNYATYFEARTKSPSFRPSFRLYHERLSLMGCLACVGAIVAIQPTAGAISFALLMAIHQFLGRAGGRGRWADSSRSSYFQHIRQNLLSMSEVEEHSRDWRPVILAFSDDPVRRERIIRFASWIEGGSGLTTAVQVLVGEGIKLRQERARAEEELLQDIRGRGLEAFARVVLAPDVNQALAVLLQATGLGPIRANTVLLNWFDQAPQEGATPGLPGYGSRMRTALRLGCNVILLEATMAEMKAVEAVPLKKRRIDVWWRGDASSRLALLLAYLMTRGADWDGARIRLVAPLDGEEDPSEAQAALERMLAEVRIEAVAQTFAGADRSAMIHGSADASIVFVPFRLRDEEPLDFFAEPFGNTLEELPVVALVLAAQDIDLESHPDEGKRAEVAAALDQAKEAEARMKAVDKEAKAAAKALEKARTELEKAEANETPAEELEALRERVAEAEGAAEQVRRRAAKAMVKARDATSEAEALAGGASEADGSPGTPESP